MLNKLYFFFFILSACLFAQNVFEPDVLLVKVSQPEQVVFEGTQVINGSEYLTRTLSKCNLISSTKMPWVGPNTTGWYKLKFSENEKLEDVKSALSACPDFSFVELNKGGILAGIPNDPLWSDQWACNLIGMPQVWDIAQADQSIIVGILDSGIDYDHEDLQGNIWTNPNEIANDNIDNDGNGYVDDIHGWNWTAAGNGNNNIDDTPGVANYHGTRIAGVIAAKTYNGTGVAGIAGGWQNQSGVKLAGLKIINYMGNWLQADAYRAISYLTVLRQHGNIVIANMSISTSGLGDEPMPDLHDAIADARDAGVILVAAGGNKSSWPNSPYYQVDVLQLPIPARYPGVFAIGASTFGDILFDEVRSSYSLYDEHKLLLTAPVDYLPSELHIITTYPNAPFYYYTFHGTSAACPIAVGTIAMMLSVNPNLTYFEIEYILKMTSEKIGPYIYSSYGRTDEVGYGRINAYEAVKLAGPPEAPSNVAIENYNNYAKIIWDENDEIDLAGYKVYRYLDPDPWHERSSWYYLTTTNDTEYVDEDFTPGFGGAYAAYKIKAIDNHDLESSFSEAVSSDGIINVPFFKKSNKYDSSTLTLDKHELFNNYPNPFNSKTNISFTLPEYKRVSLKIFNIKGQLVKVLVNTKLESGVYTYSVDTNDLQSGIYIYQLIAGKHNISKKMILLK